jgi:hypothetical protein
MNWRIAKCLFDHLVGAGEQGKRDGAAERPTVRQGSSIQLNLTEALRAHVEPNLVRPPDFWLD